MATAEAQQAPNTTGANVNVLNLLSPFLGLNATTVGQATLQNNLQQTVVINNAATLPIQQLAISDKNLLGSASNNLSSVGLGTYGAAANLAGGLPAQTPVGGITPQQPVGGFGSVLGAAYVTGSTNGLAGPLSNTVSLLSKSYSFTSSDLGVAKNYFANGAATNPSNPPAGYVPVPAVAPAGFTLPTFNGLPNTTNSVYDVAYGVTNTQPGQNVYGDSRPAQVTSQINLFDPTALNGINTNPSFPSGHTNYAYTDSILLGMLVPELYQSMLMRASEYANSRIALGVHYPLDIIASRAFASYDIAQALTNLAYMNNAAMTGTAINMPALFTAAQAELRAYLQAQGAATGCGATIAACATSAANTANDPYVPSATNQALYQSRLTYNLPTLSFAQAPREAAPAGGPDASILLATVYGGSTVAAQTIAPSGGILASLQTSTINQIIVNTETNALAAFFGTPLSYWSRIDLYSAAGYFDNVIGVLALAAPDVVKTNVTVGGDGVFGGTGVVQGNTTVTTGGTLAPGVPNAPGFASTPGTLTLQGNLVFNPGSFYAVQLNPTAASLTAVSGTAAIGSGAQATAYLAPGLYTVGARLPVLTTSTNGLSGQFSSISFTSGGNINVRPVLSYDAQDVYLTLAQANVSTPVGTQGNGVNVANALNAAVNAGVTLPASFQNLYLLTPAALASTLNQMASQTGTATAQSAFAGMNSFLGTIFDFGGAGRGPEAAAGMGYEPQGRTALRFAPERESSPEVALAYAAVTPKDRMYTKAPAAPVWAAPSWAFWGSGFGGVTRLDGDAAVGSQELTSRIAGGAAGGDYWLFPNAKIGFALAGGETSFTLANGFGSGQSDFFQGALYGKSYFGPAYVTGAVASGAQWVKNDRRVFVGATFDSLTASYTMPVLAGRLESGYRWFSTPAFGVTPYAALQSQAAFLPGFTETPAAGAGATANAVASKDVTELRSEFGAWFDTRLWWVSPILLRARAAWVHEYERNAAVAAQFATLPGATFVTTGAQLPSDAALISGVIEYPITPFVTVSGKFDGEFGNGATALAGTGKINWVW